MNEITITLTPEEQSALHQLIDAALRHAGSGALEVAMHFRSKIASARAATADVPCAEADRSAPA